MSSSSSPDPAASVPSINKPTTSMIGIIEFKDSQEPDLGSSLPINAGADIRPPPTAAGETAFLSPQLPPQNGNSIPHSLGHVENTPSTQDVSQIQDSLGNLNLDKDNLIFNADILSRCPPDGPLSTMAPNGDESLNSSNSASVSLVVPAEPSHHKLRHESDAIKRLMVLDGAELSPVIVVSSQSQSPVPFASQLQSGIQCLIDAPDSRLIDALDNPRDRLFVIKLEQDVIDFIEKNSSEVFDMPPINAYHRLLAHKMAEYYRLTHVADTSGTSVRLYRGQFARIPPTRLSDRPITNTATPTPSAANGTKSSVKIMRRADSERGSDTPPEQQIGSTPRKTASESSSGDGSAKATTREEREAAYQEARARIFKDFVESPPETPAPVKTSEKSKKQEKPDEFFGRSQFYAVPTPAPPVNPFFFPQYEDPRIQLQNNAHHHPPGPPRAMFNPNTPSFNPNTPSFHPNHPPNFFPPAPGFTPPFATPLSRQFPPQVSGSFSTPHQPQMGLPVFPQQHQRNGYYPEHAGNFGTGNSHQHPPMMATNVNSNPRFTPQPAYHGQHSGLNSIPPSIPPMASRHPYTSPSNYAVGNQPLNNQRFSVPQQQPQIPGSGWGTQQFINGGLQINGASHSAHTTTGRLSPPFGGMPYQNQHPQPWVTNGTPANFRKGPFGGNGTPGMHGPVGGM